MERLNLSEKPAHSLQESTIHCARYANILHLVKDKVVLDIACGEGYGSALLMKAGAKRVVGIDISEESILQAKKLFGDYGAEYLAGDANTVSELCGVDFFDVVISIETIEHISTPDVFLNAIKKTAKKNAIFYVTCPNDNWYYPNDNESNPYHVRKYNFQEFTELTTAVLGNSVQWAYGCAVFGFGTVSEKLENLEKIGHSWMEINEAEKSIVIGNQQLEAVNEKNCSFFAGLWNAPTLNFGNSVFPINMDAYTRITEELESNVSHVLRNVLAINDNALSILKNDVEILSSQLRKSRLLLSAIRAENNALRINIAESHLHIENMNAVKGELETNNASLAQNNASLVQKVSVMEVPYYRYLRLSAYIPRSLKNILLKTVRAIRK